MPLTVVRPSRTATQCELADQQIAVARPAWQELGQSSVADRGRDVATEQMCARERNGDAFGEEDHTVRRSAASGGSAEGRLSSPTRSDRARVVRLAHRQPCRPTLRIECVPPIVS